MNFRKFLVIISVAAIICFGARLAWAGTMPGGNDIMIKDTLDGGGRTGSSTHYRLVSAIGQPAGIGAVSGNTHVLMAGFLSTTPVAWYDLTVTLDGGGTGTVTSSPPGIDCGSTCSASYAEDTMVTLTAVADAGSEFTGWSGGNCSGTDPCQITLTSDTAVTATFVGPPTITTQPQSQTRWTGQGVSFSIVAQGDGTLSYQWQKNGTDITGATSDQYAIASLTLTDAADYNCIVSNFKGNTPSDAATLTINETVHLTGQPTAQTVVIGDPANFSVTAQGAPLINYQWKKNGGDLSGETNAALNIPAAALSDEGNYTCTVTNGGGSVTSDPAVLTVREIFTINASAGSNGSIAPSGAVSVIEGDDQAFLITPDDHYYVTEVLVDGNPVTLPGLSVGEPYTHTFTNVAQNHTIAASFAIEQVILTISTAGAGLGTTIPVVGQHQYDYGAGVPMEAFPDTGSVFSGWTGDAAGSINPTTITMTGSKAVTANFAEDVQEAPRATLGNKPLRHTNQTQYNLNVGGIGVSAYKWCLDGGSYGGEIPVTIPLIMSVTSEGRHTLNLLGRSASGQWQPASDQTTYSWNIDLTPPTAVLYNGPCPVTGNRSIDVIVGGDNVRNYRYSPDGGAYTTCYPVTSPIQVTGLAAGVHSLEVIAEDRAGNWQDAALATRIDWEVNLTVPTAVMSDLPAAITNETGIDIQVTGAAGGIDIDGFNYALDQGNWVQANAGDHIIIDGLADGPHTLYVNAHGINGAWQDGASGTDRTLATTCEWVVDTTPPVSAVPAVTAGEPSSTSVLLVWTSMEDNLERYILQYSYPWQGATKNVIIDLFYTPGPQGTNEFFELTGLTPNQTYQLKLKCVDAAGNESDWSNAATITTSNTVPIIDSFALTSNQGLSGTNDLSREIKISGQNICSAASYCIVRFLNTAHSFDLLSKGGDATGIFVEVPKGAPVGVYHLKVINKFGVSPLSTQTYEVLAATEPLPEVLQVSPVVAANNMDIPLVIRGHYFTGAISLNLLPARESQIVNLTNFQVMDDSTIEAVVPAGIPEDIYQIRLETHIGANQVSAAHCHIRVPIDLTAVDSPLVSTTPVRMPVDGVVPANLILTTDPRPEMPQNNSTDMTITANFETGTQIYDATSQPYSGIINPPCQVPVEGLSQNLDETAVAFTMGADQRLTLGQGETIIVLLEISLPGSKSDPVVYYVEADGSLTPAGIDGEKNGIQYRVGGTVFNTRFDTPETGYTTFTMGVLLDHMSTLAVSSQNQPAPTITALDPFAGPTTGGQTVTLTGANFLTGANLFIDGRDTPYTLVDAQTITYIAPAHDEGAVDIAVTNPDNQTATLQDGYLYVGASNQGGGGCFLKTIR